MKNPATVINLLQINFLQRKRIENGLNSGLGHIWKARPKGNQRHSIIFKHQTGFFSSLANTVTPTFVILSSLTFLCLATALW